VPEQWFERDPLWFKRAVFYEIHIRGFFDGNGDGSGDFRGLIEKLDYLEWLGVDCVWLLPMYSSPLRDGGYDIADFYYGDEIGMGDNVYLGDRDGVRTPMHWTGDRNAGFSHADWAQLYLQPLMDPVYGYQAVNVEAQLRTPSSFLRWVHRFIALRKEHPVFGLGTYEPLRSDNSHIFAHMRRWEDDVILCVHNVARSAQAVQLDLSACEGMVPEEMLGRTSFPAVGELPYLLTLAPRGFFWFQLRRPEP
jgi:glycosidase